MNLAVFILMGWSLLTVVCMWGALTDQEKPRVGGRRDWYDE